MTIPDSANTRLKAASSSLQASDFFAHENNISPIEPEDDDNQGGDYSARMDELFEGVDPDSMLDEEDDDDEEEFMYSGVDSATSADYHEQLREVLGSDMDHEEDVSAEVFQSETSLAHDDTNTSHLQDVTMEPLNEESFVHSPAASLTGLLTPESRTSSHESITSVYKLSRPFLHPTVSRLRSFTPQSSKLESNGSSVTSHSHFFEGMSPSLSHISTLSHLSSAHHSRTSSMEMNPQPNNDPQTRPVFRWTELQSITRTMFSKASQKASNLLGAPLLGSPTTLAANGLICIGTSEGKVVVHDFNQSLICVCQSKPMGIALGPVTALALSHDQTFVASGHTSGYIQLYNLKQPHNPVRSVPSTTLSSVASGRKEGHLQGSRIVSIGFIAGRHTALVSADEHGLAFFHSLGKILFVEAPDILRILGRYPDPSTLNPSVPSKLKAPLESSSVPTFSPVTGSQRKRRSRYTVLAMAPLPLGTVPSPTDSYHTVALLTPTKLVIVGLKPTPRTWFKCPREIDEGGAWKSSSKWVGSLAWFPTISTTGSVTSGSPRPESMADTTVPLLAYSWGTSLHFISVFESKVKQTVRSPKTGKSSEIEIGTITHERVGKWSSDEDILALQWLHHNQLIVTTRGTLGVYDLKLSKLVEKIDFDGVSLISPSTGISKGREEEVFVSHSIRSYKGKIFLLKRDRLLVGTLLTWADLILSLVEQGDFLKAIDLARAYYTGEAPGNRNNLPDDITQRKYLIGDKLRSLMDASAQYAFSEERMTDNTHVTPDNRGVDRTSLFEGLVTVCCSASVVLDDFEFLFEDLFQKYDDSGIAPIYLRQLEPFILENKIRYVPPRITQRLVALHEQDSRPDYVERIIWHMDPSCLDINQAIHLCQKYHLYDALIFIYTRAMRDYVAPIVELLALIRKVRQFRKSKKDLLNRTGSVLDADSSMESTIINAYKIYPYLANVLSGLAYPSEEPLGEEEAYQAKRDVYTFVFFGRSSMWPPGDGGKLVLTSDEDGGIEPTYPYVRQLLLFDSESFLHSLDIAFEDVYLNDESQTINRSIILRILLEIISSGHLPQQDITMVNIFIARNVPKYPQFLQITPSTLHNVLIELGQDPDQKTREDRQLAAEYLLSVYNPHDSEHIVTLFEHAGFYRILRSWHYHERRWSKLLSTYVDDPDISSLELLGQIENVIQTANRQKDVVSNDLIAIVSDSLPRLLRADIPGTALLIHKIAPELHFKSLESLGSQENADQRRYEYLRSLLFHRSEDDHNYSPRIMPTSETLSSELYKSFFNLQCRFHPDKIIPSLRDLPKEKLDLDQIMETCERHGVYDAVIWVTNWCGDPRGALRKADQFQQRITYDLLDAVTTHFDSSKLRDHLQSLQTIAQVSRNICIENSETLATDIPLEDMWFELLNGEIRSVQVISSSASIFSPLSDGHVGHNADHLEYLETIMSSLRSLVQTTFSSLVSITSTSAISFPQLFKRLVNATPSATSSHYKEFRVILTGMLESYRSDEDLLIMLKHLIDRDLFETISQVTRERAYGWAPLRGICSYCNQPLSKDSSRSIDSIPRSNDIYPIVVSRTGVIFHENCRPPSVPSVIDI